MFRNWLVVHRVYLSPALCCLMPLKTEAVNNNSHFCPHSHWTTPYTFFFKTEALVMLRGSSHVLNWLVVHRVYLLPALCDLMPFKTEIVNNNSHFCPHNHWTTPYTFFFKTEPVVMLRGSSRVSKLASSSSCLLVTGPLLSYAHTS